MKSLKRVDWKELRRRGTRQRGRVVSWVKDKLLTDIENKARAATNVEPYGPTHRELSEIAAATYDATDFALVMDVIWSRLNGRGRHWRRVYKALDLLRFLLMHGSPQVLVAAQAGLAHLQTLQDFRYFDPRERRDCGAAVRQKAQVVVAMLQSPARLEQERQQSLAMRRKMGLAASALDAQGRDTHGGSSSNSMLSAQGQYPLGSGGDAGSSAAFRYGSDGEFSGYRNARADSLDETPRAGPISMSRERRAASFDDNSWQRGSMPTEALIAADAGESPANLPNNGATAEAVGDGGRDTKQERVERTVGGAATTTPLPSIDDWDFFAQIDATHEGDPTVMASSSVASDEHPVAIAANGAFPPSVKVTSSARASVVQRATDDPFASLFSELSLRPEHASATPSLR
ncbi:hypothetical protein CDCA_CDCA01G0329 [Cyanidium caldarium]|uniref:ENTH domain-containing protein n=1 Tax=Cyanidium caldarium TaxID=2771 RepID=A0AAV9IQ70_CYACA|nr:hypothetical protein CDCA_CDCA01G0329 [Cyanidium caldarium]